VNKRTKICLSSGLAVVAICGLGSTAMMTRTNSELASEQRAARALGIPLDESDLETPPIPADQNAAEVYRKIGGMLAAIRKEDTERRSASDRLSGFAGSKGPGSSPEPAPKTIFDLQKQQDDSLPALGPVFEEVRKLDTRPGCDFGAFGTSPAIADLELTTSFFTLVRDLCAKADFQDRHGDWKGALQWMRYAYRAAIDHGARPMFMSLLEQCGDRMSVNKEYGKLLARHPNNLGFLQATETQLHGEGALPDVRRDLGGEVVFSRFSIRALKGFAPDVPSTDSDSELASDAGTSDDGSESHGDGKTTLKSSLAGFEFRIIRSKSVQQAIESNYLRAWRLSWSHFPSDRQDWQQYGRAMKLANEYVQKDKSLLNSNTRQTFPVYLDVADSIGIEQTWDRLLLTSIALLRTRSATGRLPVALPSSLGTTRLDPFDGNPLRYRREGSGFILYSIGADRRDDGGHAQNFRDPDGTGSDEVVEFQ
jgi:hypothetical protein